MLRESGRASHGRAPCALDPILVSPCEVSPAPQRAGPFCAAPAGADNRIAPQAACAIFSDCPQNRCRCSRVVLPLGSVMSAVSGPLNVMVTGATLSFTRVAGLWAPPIDCPLA